MNYGDYAYIEAFRYGMYSFFPAPNQARRAQLFEVWIRPVPPAQAHHALRIAVHELERLVEQGLSQEDFEATREYLSKNVYLLTATQSAQLGYALDSRFYGIGDYAEHMRTKLAALTLDQVNDAIRRHLQARNLYVAMVTEDAAGLREQLISDAPSSIEYASEKPPELLAEDELIGARKLHIGEERVRIVPVEEVWAE
jgi:zinc protease